MLPVNFLRRRNTIPPHGSPGSHDSRSTLSQNGSNSPQEHGRLIDWDALSGSADDIAERFSGLSLGGNAWINARKDGEDDGLDASNEDYSRNWNDICEEDNINSVADNVYEVDLEEVETLMKKKNDELKELLRMQGLKVGGRKVDLVNRLLGLEEHENEKEETVADLVLTFDTLKNCTNKTLKAKLKSMGLPTGGVKKALIDRLLGLEPPMPKEGWDNSKDKSLCTALLREHGEGSIRYMSAEEVHQLSPFDRWPFYRFKPNFYNLRDTVIHKEAIVEQDILDFLADLAAHPPKDITRKGMFDIFLVHW